MNILGKWLEKAWRLELGDWGLQQRILERTEYALLFIRLFQPFVVLTALQWLVTPTEMSEEMVGALGWR